MPLQNRVTPLGEIIADPARGDWMGNRGILVRPDGMLGAARWKLRAWLICRLEFRGRRTPLWDPHRYTPLFFLDEATALAAGHRPCFECRRTDAERFARAWMRGAGFADDVPRARVDVMDRQLHVERLAADGGKNTHVATFGELPDGTMILGRLGPELKWANRAWRWSPSGYEPAATIDAGSIHPGTGVDVLTPRSTVAAIRAGYVPAVHNSVTREGVEPRQ